MSAKQPILDSKITLQDLIDYTYSKYRNRYLNKDRDVLIKVTIKEIKKYDRVEKKLKETYYKIEYTTYSYPSYGVYMKHTTASKQRKYKHQYNGVIELLTLSLASKVRWRTGWDRKPPTVNRNQLKTISMSERKAIRSQVEVSMRNKTKSEVEAEYKKRIKARRDKAQYLSYGDYCGRLGENTVMLDWWYRISYPLKKVGALYGKFHADSSTEPVAFLDKHALRMVLHLFLNGYISKN